MRFPSRLFSSVNRPAAQAFALAVMVSALASGAGCEDKHIGRQCELKLRQTAPLAPTKKGFFCTWPTTVGPFCCQKMCVCRDFVGEPPGGSKIPQACTSRAAGGCQNVQ